LRFAIATNSNNFLKTLLCKVFKKLFECNYSGLNFNNIFQEVIKEEVGFDE